MRILVLVSYLRYIWIKDDPVFGTTLSASLSLYEQADCSRDASAFDVRGLERDCSAVNQRLEDLRVQVNYVERKNQARGWVFINKYHALEHLYQFLLGI